MQAPPPIGRSPRCANGGTGLTRSGYWREQEAHRGHGRLDASGVVTEVLNRYPGISNPEVV